MQRCGGRLLLTTAADRGAQDLLGRLDGWDGRVDPLWTGRRRAGDARSQLTAGGATLPACSNMRSKSPLAGEHNVLNATAALTLAHELGRRLDALAEGLRTFPGAGRRMELIADTAGVIVYDDYAHHPTEVRATIGAARQRWGSDVCGRSSSRTCTRARRSCSTSSPHAFTDADEVVIADIFASRDTDEALRATSAEALADAHRAHLRRAGHRGGGRGGHDDLRRRAPARRATRYWSWGRASHIASHWGSSRRWRLVCWTAQRSLPGMNA